MRKKFIAVISVLLSLFSLFSFSTDTYIKQKSMSLVGLADCTGNINYFYNPAGVHAYNQASKFISTLGYSDYHKSGDEYLFFRPETYLISEFISKNISLSIGIDVNVPTDPEYNGKNFIYDLNRDVIFNCNMATGFSDFSFGVGLYGGSSMEKRSVSNIVYQALFGKFERIEGSDFINIRAGALYRLNHFSFGLTADRVFLYEGDRKQMTFENAADYISAGMYWAEDKYEKRGRLKLWVLNAGIECLNILNNDERTLSAGGEASIQLKNGYSISFRTGISVPMYDFSESVHSFGVGTRLEMFDVGLSASVPVNIYMGNKDEISVNVAVSFIK